MENLRTVKKKSEMQEQVRKATHTFRAAQFHPAHGLSAAGGKSESCRLASFRAEVEPRPDALHASGPAAGRQRR